MSSQTPASPTVRLVHFLMAHARWVLVVSALLGLVCGYRTVLTYSSLKSELEELLPKSAPSVAALQELRQRLPGLRFLGVVLETDDPARAADADQFLDRLAERVRSYPPDLVRGVRLDTKAEREFAERYALQLMEPADVKKLREAVEARRDYEVSRAMGSDLEDEADAEKPPELPLEELRGKYQARFGSAATARQGDRFISPDGRDRALLIQTSSTSTGFEADSRLLGRVQADVAALGGPPPGSRLGYAGDVATRVEETHGLASDLGLSSAVVALLVVGSLVWFYRSWSALVALFVPLAIGTWAGFALVALPPLSIRYLNTNTAFLGSIVVGNGINSGIMLLSRIQEELAQGKSVRDSVAVGVRESWRATFAAALASAASYVSLVFTDFRGFNQFGWIGGFGIVLCWAAMYVVMPALCVYLGERLRPRAPAKAPTAPASPSIAARVQELTIRYRGAVLVGLAIMGAISVAGLATRRGDWIEYDLSKLRRKDSWVDGERYWGKRMDAATGRYLTPSVVMAKDAADVPQLEAKLRELKEKGGAGDLIAEVRSAQQLLPDTRAASIEEGKLLKAAITPKLRSKLKDSERELLERALSEASLVPLTAADLPEAFAAGLRERDGTVGRSVLVFPKVGGGTWQSERLGAFARDLRLAAAGAGAIAAGPLLLSSDLADALRSDGPRVTLLSFLCVLGICIAAFGVASRQAWGFSALSIATLLLGVAFMLGLLSWSGAKLNFSNFVALPITFGISADYSINMLRRFQSGDESEEGMSNASGALAMCSATTVIGWGALLLVENQALFSFGVFAISGELASLVAATLALPAVLSYFTAASKDRKLRHSDTAPTAPG